MKRGAARRASIAAFVIALAAAGDATAQSYRIDAAVRVDDASGVDTLRVDRFIVRSNVLLEVGMVIAHPAQMPEQAFADFARGESDRFLSGVGTR